MTDNTYMCAMCRTEHDDIPGVHISIFADEIHLCPRCATIVQAVFKRQNPKALEVFHAWSNITKWEKKIKRRKHDG